MSVILNDTASWGLILGVALPFLTALVQKPEWSPVLRRLVAVGAAIVVGLLTALAGGDIAEGGTVLATVAAVLVASQSAYGLLWKPTQLPAKLEGVRRGQGRHKADPEPQDVDAP